MKLCAMHHIIMRLKPQDFQTVRKLPIPRGLATIYLFDLFLSSVVDLQPSNKGATSKLHVGKILK